MQKPTIKEQIITALDKLTEKQQTDVLDYIKSNLLLEGTAGEAFMELTKEFYIDDESAAQMMQAIEEDREQSKW